MFWQSKKNFVCNIKGHEWVDLKSDHPVYYFFQCKNCKVAGRRRGSATQIDICRKSGYYIIALISSLNWNWKKHLERLWAGFLSCGLLLVGSIAIYKVASMLGWWTLWVIPGVAIIYLAGAWLIE